MNHRSTRRLLGLAALAALLAGCGDRAAPAAEPAPASTAASKAYTIEQLAAAVGCTPKSGGRTTDFRQANCTVGGDDFMFLQFDDASRQRDWLRYATLYGGVYLAGDRWVLSGRSKEYLLELQAELGGEIEEGS